MSAYYDGSLFRRYSQYKHAAKKGGRAFELTAGEFSDFWRKECFYCGEIVPTIGLDRIDNKKGYTYNNVVSCCRECNFMKGKMDIKNFLERAKKINNHHTKTNLQI